MDKVEVGKIYYVPDKNALNTCFRVEVMEIIDNRSAKVIASPKHPNSKKKKQKPLRPFIIPMFLLHEKQEDAFIKDREKLYRKTRKKKRKPKENNKHENHK